MKCLAVLMTVHNRKQITLACLKNLYEQELPHDYIVDVYMTDDGCTDGTSEAVTDMFPRVNIVYGNGCLYWNRGMIAAWRAAVENCDYDYYLWLNDDTVLEDDSVRMLLCCADETGDKAIIVGSTCDTAGIGVITYSGYGKDGKRITPNGRLQQCEYFNGNIVLIPRCVFGLVGMNDSRFSHSIGDFDYGLRAKKKGVCSFVTPKILGRCDRHNRIPVWCDPNVSFMRRLKSFVSPLGAAPFEYFIFDRRHKGLLKACYGLAVSTVMSIVPWLFVSHLKKNKMFFDE